MLTGNYTPGTPVEVFSNSLRSWCTGRVQSLAEAPDGNPVVHCCFGDGLKMKTTLPPESADLRIGCEVGDLVEAFWSSHSTFSPFFDGT